MLMLKNPVAKPGTPPAVASPSKPAPVQQQNVIPVPIPTPPPTIVAPPAQNVIPATVAPAQAVVSVTRTARPALPAHVIADASDKPVGFENVGNEASRMAMLSIAQSQSPQVQENRTMQAGSTYMTTDRDVEFFPSNIKVPVIACHYYKSWDQWNHRDLGGGLVTSSVEPAGPNAKQAQAQLAWRRANKGRQPTAQEEPVRALESLNFLGLFKVQDVENGPVRYVPVIIPFAKSKYRKGASWINLIMKASEGKYPIYSFEYTIQTVFEKGKLGNYYNFDVDFSADPLSAEDYAQAKIAHDEFDVIFRSKQLQVEQDKTDTTPEIEIIEGGADPKTPAAPGSY